MASDLEGAGNLWLAQVLSELGGVEFGDFTFGSSTVNSPIYINARLLVSRPEVMRRIANIIHEETVSAQARRRRTMAPFDLVAGVPLGGLHMAGAYSIINGTPLIYPRFDGKSGQSHFIEGRYEEGQHVLIVDDLITSGTTVMNTANLLREAGLEVTNALVLVDRDQGAAERLHRHGIDLISILPIRVMLQYLMESHLISRLDFDRSMAYVDRTRDVGEN